MVKNVFTQTVLTVRAWVWAQEQEMIYKVVVQAVLIYGRKIWVVIFEMLKVLKDFHYRMSRQIVGKTNRSTVERE